MTQQASAWTVMSHLAPAGGRDTPGHPWVLSRLAKN